MENPSAVSESVDSKSPTSFEKINLCPACGQIAWQPVTEDNPCPQCGLTGPVHPSGFSTSETHLQERAHALARHQRPSLLPLYVLLSLAFIGASAASVWSQKRAYQSMWDETPGEYVFELLVWKALFTDAAALVFIYGACRALGRVSAAASPLLDNFRREVLWKVFWCVTLVGTPWVVYEESVREAEKINYVHDFTRVHIPRGEAWQTVGAVTDCVVVAVTIVLLMRIRPVRVLFLRSFHAGADQSVAPVVVRTCSFWGRVEALCTPWERGGDGRWKLIGHEDKWRRGVSRLLDEDVHLVVADISITSAENGPEDRNEGLKWELRQLRARPNVKQVYICSQKALAAALQELPPDLDPSIQPIIYTSPRDLEFVRALLDAVEPVPWHRRLRWQRHRAQIEREFRALHEPLPVSAVS